MGALLCLPRPKTTRAPQHQGRHRRSRPREAVRPHLKLKKNHVHVSNSVTSRHQKSDRRARDTGHSSQVTRRSRRTHKKCFYCSNVPCSAVSDQTCPETPVPPLLPAGPLRLALGLARPSARLEDSLFCVWLSFFHSKWIFILLLSVHAFHFLHSHGAG